MSKPKGRRAHVRKGKVTARKVSDILNSIARLVRAVGVLVDALSKWIGQAIPLLGESPGWHPGGSPPLWLTPFSPVHSPTILIRSTHETWIHLRGTLRSSAAPAAGRVALGLIRAISGGRM